jgi:hypothetical protein
MKINRWRRASHARATRRGGCRCSGGRKEGWREKNLLQPGCKPGRLQPLTKMRIDPTCRLIIQQKRYLVDLQVGPILIFVRGCKRPGLQPGCNKFFSGWRAAAAAAASGDASACDASMEEKLQIKLARVGAAFACAPCSRPPCLPLLERA